jgi:hypothetical protein
MGSNANGRPITRFYAFFVGGKRIGKKYAGFI